MKYKIITTLGPSSQAESAWNDLLYAGATTFRLNTSHLTLPQLREWLDRYQAFLRSAEAQPPLVLDLQGSKWRLGQFTPFELVSGEFVDLLHAATTDRPGSLPVPHADFFRAAPRSSGEIVLNDAKIRLRLETSTADSVRARVMQGGPISPNKGITFTASEYRTETLSEKDQAILAETAGMAWVHYAVSYVKDAAEMARYRALFTARLSRPTYLIAKLERGPAVAEARQVAEASDELWLCRGDLGAELGLKDMARAVAQLSGEVSSLPIPVIMAGQVLEHMTEHATPTRSEVCYLYDALSTGYNGFVLSDETAIGRHPVESCRIAAMFREQPA